MTSIVPATTDLAPVSPGAASTGPRRPLSVPVVTHKVTDKHINDMRRLLAEQEDAQQTRCSKILLCQHKERDARTALEEMRESAAQRLAVCTEQKEQFLQKQAALRQLVSSNEFFIADLDGKTDKGLRRKAECEADIERMKLEVADLQKKNEELTQLTADVREETERMRPHHEYLDKVARECSEFGNELEAVVGRRGTLNAIYERTQADETQYKEDFELFQRARAKHQREVDQRAIFLSAQLHDAQIKIDAVRVQRQEVQQRESKMTAAVQAESARVSRLQRAIRQTFTRLQQTCAIEQRARMMGDHVESAAQSGDSREQALMSQVSVRLGELSATADAVKAYVRRYYVKPQQEAPTNARSVVEFAQGKAAALQLQQQGI